VGARGVLLVNLGSPDAPTIPAVRRYLDEFLMDPCVIDSPRAIRRLIVSGFILPFRPKRTAHAYASIWGPEGSPLVALSRKFAAGLAERVPVPVSLAMRYGSPTVDDALQELLARDVREILLFALYPHHADSTRTTAIRFVRNRLARLDGSVGLRIVPPFYDDPAYIAALSGVCRRHLPAAFDLLLFSFHGIPERHVRRADPTGTHCLEAENCCEVRSSAHASCYRHQTRVTARLAARSLGLDEPRWAVSYQSRLGRLPWLTPYTDDVLDSALERGIRRLVVACPAFVADNLETLEEIGIRGRERFLAAGGEDFTLIPCLDDDACWLEVVAGWCLDPPPESPIDGH